MPTLSTNDLFIALTKAATLFTTAMFARTNAPGYPHTKQDHDRIIYSIQESTRIGAPISSENKTYIDIIIDLKKAPYAAAYEFGADEYTIEPKPGGPGLLFFPGSDWPKYKPPPPKPNLFVFPLVTHWEIKAKPFLKPTIDEKRAEMTAIIGGAFKEAYIRSIGERKVVIK